MKAGTRFVVQYDVSQLSRTFMRSECHQRSQCHLLVESMPPAEHMDELVSYFEHTYIGPTKDIKEKTLAIPSDVAIFHMHEQ